MNQNEWLDAITKLYPRLHLDERVIHHSNKSDKKKQKVLSWLEKIEEIHNKVAKKKDKHLEQLYKGMYYNLYVIKEEDIPESYYLNQQRILRERGYGTIEITDEIKHRLARQVIEDQKESLDKWIEYFLYDEESKSYPIWEKYWVFQGLQNLGKYNKEKGIFSKRDKTTVYPFPLPEREAIFTTLNLMEQYLKDKKGPEEIKTALGQSNFKTLYEFSINQILNKGTKANNRIDGVWIKYDQGSDYNILRNSLQGYYTGWCTAAGENFAKSQLEEGDFYVYYSKDENNECKIPRIAIRMHGHNEIAEIRGIANDQNMEPEMMPILNKKLEEFPDRDKYFKKEKDMQYLTMIDNKVKQNIELTIEELKFLYEIDNKIEGFGYKDDPRINEIKQKRSIRKDLSLIYNCKENEIGIEEIDEFKPNNNKFKMWYKNLDLKSIKKAEGLTMPQSIGGNLDLRNLTSAEGLILPESVGGNLNLNGLTSAEGLTLPKSIRGSLSMNGLTSAEGLTLPKSIGGYLSINNLTKTEGLILPKSIGGYLSIDNLTSAEGLKLPQSIGWSLSLNSLTSAEGLILPESIEGNLYLNGLTNAKGLKLPQSIGGNLYLNGLTSAKGLTLPQSIGRNLYLNGLISAEGLILPESVGEDLYLNSLTSAEGLILPESVGEDLYLNSLTSAKDLKLPQSIGCSLYLNDLTSAEGLTLPQSIGGDLDLSGLTSAEGLTLPQSIGGDLDLSGLTSAEGLTLPQSIGWSLYLNSLSSAEGLILPKSVGGYLSLDGLMKAEGLMLPENVGGDIYLNEITSIEEIEFPKIFKIEGMIYLATGPIKYEEIILNKNNPTKHR